MSTSKKKLKERKQLRLTRSFECAAKDGAIYDVLDNGGRPFRVRVNTHDKTIDVGVLKESEKGDDNDDEQRRYAYWRSFRYDRLWLGFGSWDAPDKGPADGELAWTLGNSVLAQRGRRFLFVGWKVESFAIPAGERVVRFVSLVGNSWVPTPELVTDKAVYLLVEHKRISLRTLAQAQARAALNDKPILCATDYYYGWKDRKPAPAAAAQSVPFRLLHRRLE